MLARPMSRAVDESWSTWRAGVTGVNGGERLLGVARLVRWSETHPPEEADLRARLQAEGLEPYRWSNGPHAFYAEHRHTYHKVLYVVRGSIAFTLTDRGQTLALQPGDRLELPPYTNHTAQVGPEGVVCLEAPRQ